jgi:ABC-type Zn uptake system ZnuABC Zn-binding protein ZnuA
MPGSRSWNRTLAGAAALAATLAVLVGCGGAKDDTSAGRIAIATTVAPITSIVSSVGGDRVEITGIVPEGVNSHTFEPKPSAAALLSRVDALYVNGLRLEEPTKQLALGGLKAGADIVELGTSCIDESGWIYDFSFPRSDGKPNPHLWTDPGYARCYAAVVRDDLSNRDPENAQYYASNYESFSAMIDSLDTAMRESFETIPRRELLTYHDAYAYFAKSYGWKVIGAIQVSDFEDPTPKEVASLIEQVKASGVPAIFGSEVFPSPVLEQIGEEAGARYVDVLRDDDLPGAPGEPEHSWVGLMLFNYVTMTEALGGDATALKAFQPGALVSDTAEYPQ